MLQPEKGLVFGTKTNFDQFFLQFNVKRKNAVRVTLKEHSQFDWKY